MLSKASNQTKYQMTAPVLIFSRKLQTKDAQSGNKLVGLPTSLPRELTRGEPVQIRKQGSINDLTSNRLGFIPCVRFMCKHSTLHSYISLAQENVWDQKS